MVVVDAIRPPRKKTNAKTKRPSTAPVTQPVTPPTIESPASAKPLAQRTEHERRQLLWYLVVGTMLVVFLAWLFIFPNTADKNTNSGYLHTLGEKLSSLWQTIKTDILKIKSGAANLNTNTEEKVKNLENQVFPQFNDPTKQ